MRRLEDDWSLPRLRLLAVVRARSEFGPVPMMAFPVPRSPSIKSPVFPASRKRVYEALTDVRQFDKIVQLSGAMQSGMALGRNPTEISRQVGGAFTLFGGHITGRHIELAPDQRIVQAWRVVDWIPGVYSIVKFELTEQGSDTKIIFDHTGFPEGKAQHLAEGWKANYWEPLQKYLAS